MPIFPFAFWKSGGTTPPPTFVTDNFNRADAWTYGTNWNIINDGPYVRIVSNKATQAAGASSYPNCLYAGSFTFTANQYSKCDVVLPDPTNTVVELIVRASGSSISTLSNYTVTIGQGGWDLYKMVNGVEAEIAYDGATTFQTGDIVELRVIGSTITLYKNGVLVSTNDDTSITTGSPGFNLVANNGSFQAAIDNWEGGNL